MDEAEAKARYEAAMRSRPVNEKEIFEAHRIDMYLQSHNDLRPDVVQQLSYKKASLEASAHMSYSAQFRY